jgi:hypothetical protein
VDLTIDLINGLMFGIEYVGKDEEAEIESSAIFIDFACFRAIIWLND